MPRSIVLRSGSEKNLHSLIYDSHQSEYWYLRFDEVVAPELPRIARTDELETLIIPALERHPSISIVVQERVTARISGALASNQETLFVEHVSRELQALLRLGVTPSRTLLQSDYIACQEVNEQEFHCHWEDAQFIRDNSPAVPPPLTGSTVSQLADAGRKARGVAVLEWIERGNGEVVFLDYREMSKRFLGTFEQIADGFRCRIFRTLPPRGEDDQDVAVTNTSAGLHFHRPLYDYTGQLSARPRSIWIDTGGVLSHLSVYAADLNIPCILGPAKMNKEPRNKRKASLTCDDNQTVQGSR